MPNVSITTGGLFDPAKLTAWMRSRQQQIHRGVGRAMRSFGKEEDAKLKAHVSSALKLKSKRLLRAVKHKVFDRKQDEPPAMIVGLRKLPLGGAHEHGATIRGAGRGLLIPLNLDQRISAKRFRAIVTDLIRSGNAFFKKVNGRVILFAENIRESDKGLARWKRNIRASTGTKKIARGTEIPIAVLVPSVTLKKRLNVERIVRGDLGRLAQLMEQEISKR